MPTYFVCLNFEVLQVTMNPCGLCLLQGWEERLDVVVSSLKQLYGLRYIYCWHGLSSYWSGISPDKREAGVAKYNARLVFSEVLTSPLCPHCVLAVLNKLRGVKAGSSG